MPGKDKILKTKDAIALWQEDKDAGKKLRRLRELASIAKGHSMVIYFFVEELKARRFEGHHWLKLLPNKLYELFGDFDKSISRPIYSLLGVWLVFSALYFWLSDTLTGSLDPIQTSVTILPRFIEMNNDCLRVELVWLILNCLFLFCYFCFHNFFDRTYSTW